MATSKVLKPRRGSTAEHNTFKGQAFEITFDTDKKTIVAHDGLTMGGFPLAHEAALSEADNALRALIDQKVAEVEGVSSSELSALESALRGLIHSNAQQQSIRDNDQDNVIVALRALIQQELEKKLNISGGTINYLNLPLGGLLSNDNATVKEILLASDKDGVFGAFLSLHNIGCPDVPGGARLFTRNADGSLGPMLDLHRDGYAFWNNNPILTIADSDSVAGYAMPSTRHVDLPRGASGVQYTAPANGYIVYSGSCNASGRLHMAGPRLNDSRYAPAGDWVAATLPVKKGDVVTFWYNGTFSFDLFRFIYAEGAF